MAKDVQFDFSGKVALVTGSGRAKGLGEAIAQEFARGGADVVIHDRGALSGDIAPAHGIGTTEDMRAVEAGLAEISPRGAQAVASFAADMQLEDHVEALIDFTVERFGRLDFLINNAGIGYLFAPLMEMQQEHWDAVLNVNLRGPFFAIKHAARRMTAQVEAGEPPGRIVNIASVGGKRGSPRVGAYAASKHGLIGLTRVAARELAPHGITVNAVCPNHVTTGLGSWQNDYMAKAQGKSVEVYLREMAERIPLGRVGLPEDTANICAFLCSELGSYVTGDALNVSGGEVYY